MEHGDIKAPLAKDQDLDAITMEEVRGATWLGRAECLQLVSYL